MTRRRLCANGLYTETILYLDHIQSRFPCAHWRWIGIATGQEQGVAGLRRGRQRSPRHTSQKVAVAHIQWTEPRRKPFCGKFLPAGKCDKTYGKNAIASCSLSNRGVIIRVGSDGHPLRRGYVDDE